MQTSVDRDDIKFPVKELSRSLNPQASDFDNLIHPSSLSIRLETSFMSWILKFQQEILKVSFQ